MVSLTPSIYLYCLWQQGNDGTVNGSRWLKDRRAALVAELSVLWIGARAIRAIAEGMYLVVGPTCYGIDQEAIRPTEPGANNLRG